MAKKTDDAETQRNDGDAQQTPPDPFAWDPDPVVVVSRRNRILHFPGALLRGPVPDEQRARWFTSPQDLAPAAPGLLRNQDPKDLELNYGVTFLGVLTTCWKYRTADERSIPRGAPPEVDRVIVEPHGRHARPLLIGPAFKDPESGKRIAGPIAAAWQRVLAHLADERGEAHRLFVADDAYDTPEVMVLRLSEVLRGSTDAGRAAAAITRDAAERSRRLDHLGALHDYAVRERAASGIVAACRKRAQAVPASRLGHA